ncbi:hypothetical protein PV08_02273 [Exophiala spinifera]|uniref:Uncharacterized protein n=1 Tax=Exophiala spinifera TaxID=91928 RepID=A0A0D1ZZ96_9EURO|nr:uncharacterized protein PV08_02273 [Exophiala spinifera]KIW17987.1 hypothetical protein PV08_02273 [Exophiala spinifera]
MPMTGPLHGAALETLDTFRSNGLYLGLRRGVMLGSTFLRDTEAKNRRILSVATIEEEKECRNGIWIRVLREAKYVDRKAGTLQRDSETTAVDNRPPYRAMQLVHHLKLKYADNAEGTGATVVSEGSVSWRAILGIFVSELSSIAIAITAAVAKPFKTWWLAVYLCVPLLLKLISLLVSVRRTTIHQEKIPAASSSAPKDDLYEILDGNHSFGLIESPEITLRQFFRHYGHPIRDSGVAGRRDRAREVHSMALVYLFVLYFPAGLISSLWMPSNVQLLWLSFQVYMILVMHIVRICGWEHCGQTEGRIARLLQGNRKVFLQAKKPAKYGVIVTFGDYRPSQCCRSEERSEENYR